MYTYIFFFFKQKTAYEMRISDWSSDVCSSDLPDPSDTVVATNPDDGSVAPPHTETSQVPSDVPTYTLDLPGAELLREESLMARNSDVVLWGDGEGAYLSLSVRPGVSGTYGAPSGLGPKVRDSALPEIGRESGRAGGGQYV